jgi:hypothetical protein
MRPIDRQTVAQRAAEQFVDRDAERLRLDVDQRILDRRDRHLIDAARRLPRRRIEQSRDRFDRARVAADQKALGETLNDAGQPLRAITLHVFRPPGDALVCGDLQKGIDPPAGVAMQVFDLGDFHGTLPVLAAAIMRPGTGPAQPRALRRRAVTPRGRIHYRDTEDREKDRHPGGGRDPRFSCPCL